MHATKFKLKNGNTVQIRRVTAADYDAIVHFMNKFSRDPGAKLTWMHTGTTQDRTQTLGSLPNQSNLYIAAWDCDNIIGMSEIRTCHHNHPYGGASAVTEICILKKYTSNGLGSKLLHLMEKWAHKNNIHRIDATVRHNNISAINIMLNNEYIITGTRHDIAFIDNKWRHEYIMEKML